MQFCKFFVAATDLRVSRMFRQLATILLALAMKGQIFFTHGRLQQFKSGGSSRCRWRPADSPRRQSDFYTINIVTVPNFEEIRRFC